MYQDITVILSLKSISPKRRRKHIEKVNKVTFAGDVTVSIAYSLTQQAPMILPSSDTLTSVLRGSPVIDV
jgi:hypothetical protein